MTPNSTITINPMGADALHSILDAPIIESNLTEANTNISGGVIQISATHPNLTEPLISGNLDLRANGCPAVGANLKIPFSINSTYQFGGLGNPQLFLEPTNPTIDSLHALGGTGRNFIFLGTNIERNATISGATITGTDCKFNGFTLSDVVWKGSFEMRTNCRGTAPIFKNDGNVSTHATDFNLKINTNDKATFDLSGAGVSPYFNLLGTLNLVNGKVMVKGGTLDLRMATVQGLSANRFFMTEHGTNNTLGAVLLPVVANNVNPVTFNLGVSIPNGANPPTNVYAPISVLSTNGRAMMWR